MINPSPSSTPRRNSAGLRRDLELLHVLGSPEAEQNGGLGVVQLAEATGRDKAVVSRSLATLADAGIVERDTATQQYRLGYQLYALAARTMESRLTRQARRSLRAIVTATHETAHLCVLRGGNVLTLTSETSHYGFRALGWEGVTTAAWQTSSGRALISDWPDEEVRRWYDEHGRDSAVTGPAAPVVRGEAPSRAPVAASDKQRVTDADTLLAELALIRTRGYAAVDEEFEVGVVGVSAPVLDFRDRVVAALNVSAPKARFGEGDLDRVGAFVAATARELSRQMGATEGQGAAGNA